jgi:DNA-directed RNA polymerase subunit RPC12/RpoP
MFGRLKKRIPETRIVVCPSCGKQHELDKGVLSAFCTRCHRRLTIEEAPTAVGTGRIPMFAGDAPSHIEVTCPHCGQKTPAPPMAINVTCRHCHELFPLRQGQPVVKPKRGGRVDGARAQVVRCYACGAEVTAAEEALSTMCPKCGQRVELRDLEVNARRQQDVFTCGRLYVSRKGIVEGRVNAREVLVEGEVRGDIISVSSLVIGSTGRCYGGVKARALRVDAGAILEGPVRLNEELLEAT